MDKSLTTVPRPAQIAAAMLAVAAFALSLLVEAAMPAKTVWHLLPLGVVTVVWMVPLMLALIRGERWAFVFALAVLLFTTDASFRARSWADKSIDWQVALKGLTWLGCGFAGAVHLSRTLPLLSRPPAWAALAFLLVLLASSAWSPVPGYSLMSGLAFLCLFTFALAAAQFLDERGFCIALAVGTGLIVLPSLAISPFMVGISPTSPGSTGEMDRLRGLTDHPIPLAEAAATFAFACLALRQFTKGAWRRTLCLALALCGIATLVLTQSRIPGLAMVAAVLGYWAYRKGGWLLMVPSMVMVAALALMMEAIAPFATLLPHDILELFARSGSSKEILTLSGRLTIWPYAWEHVQEALVLGHGHASGVTIFKGFTPWKIVHAHNAYLQALLYVGVVGASLLIGAILCQIKVFLDDPKPVRDVMMLYLLLKGVTEQSMMGNMPSSSVELWLVTVCMAAVAWNRRPAARRQQPVVSAAGSSAGTAPG